MHVIYLQNEEIPVNNAVSRLYPAITPSQVNGTTTEELLLSRSSPRVVGERRELHNGN